MELKGPTEVWDPKSEQVMDFWPWMLEEGGTRTGRLPSDKPNLSNQAWDRDEVIKRTIDGSWRHTLMRGSSGAGKTQRGKAWLRTAAMAHGFPFRFASYSPRKDDGLREIYDYTVNNHEELEEALKEIYD